MLQYTISISLRNRVFTTLNTCLWIGYEFFMSSVRDLLSRTILFIKFRILFVSPSWMYSLYFASYSLINDFAWDELELTLLLKLIIIYKYAYNRSFIILSLKIFKSKNLFVFPIFFFLELVLFFKAGSITRGWLSSSLILNYIIFKFIYFWFLYNLIKCTKLLNFYFIIIINLICKFLYLV